MTHRFINHLRAHRDRGGLTQDELAKLIGRRAGSTISRYESGVRTPPIRVALACEVVFGASPKAMFPGVYERVEDTTMQRAARLMRRLEGKTDDLSIKQQRLLTAMARRARGNVAPV